MDEQQQGTQQPTGDTPAQPPYSPVQQQSGGAPPQPPQYPAYTPQPPQPQSQDASQRLWLLHRQIRSGGSWFYWIAALSLINTVIALSHGTWQFIFGLGFTRIFDELMRERGGAATLIGLPINILVAAIYFGFGYFACQRMKWAFIVGMVFYTLDALLCLSVGFWIGVAFHAYVLYCLMRGLKADAEARQIEAQMQQMGTPGQPTPGSY